ncbi:MAG: hypothetical protein ACREAA_02230 [Candidatus Polarisedimenticolia bacterium]
MDERMEGDPWAAATWEGARRAMLEAALNATPAQRLAWLEEALDLLRQVRRTGPGRRAA